MDGKSALETLNDELNNLNIKIGVFGASVRGTEDEKVIYSLKCDVLEAQRKLIKSIERLYY